MTPPGADAADQQARGPSPADPGEDRSTGGKPVLSFPQRMDQHPTRGGLPGSIPSAAQDTAGVVAESHTRADQPLAAARITAMPRPNELLNALRDAHTYYRRPRTLDDSWVPDYLNRRNLYPQLRQAEIGYAPTGWTHLLDHLRRLGHSDGTLVAAGLARQASTGRLIDHFRDRLMIPILDADGQLAGFTGRSAPEAKPDVPKYLNSPATPLFDKSRLLYGAGEDHDTLKAGAMAILVEGPLDRLAIRQAAGNLVIVGVAPLGTAFTDHHAQQLADITGRRRPVAVAFDPDPAGRHAVVRAWDQLTDAGITNLLHVALPHDHDPADLVRAGHHQQLRHAIIHARPLSLAVADHRIAEAGTLDHFDKRYAVLHHVLDHDLPRIPPNQISTYLAHLTQQLHLDHTTVTAAAVDRITPADEAPSSTQDANELRQRQPQRPTTTRAQSERRPQQRITVLRNHDHGIER